MEKQPATGLSKLLENQLADMYYAEKQLVELLGRLARTAKNGELKEAFAKHREETKGHVERLERVFKILGRPPNGRKCPAIDGIIQEGMDVMNEHCDDLALDFALVAAGQKAELYEIATYGSMCEWAKELGLTTVQDLLHETLEEEKATDERLIIIAESVLHIESGIV